MRKLRVTPARFDFEVAIGDSPASGIIFKRFSCDIETMMTIVENMMLNMKETIAHVVTLSEGSHRCHYESQSNNRTHDKRSRQLQPGIRQNECRNKWTIS
jgi:hypothetical protein